MSVAPLSAVNRHTDSGTRPGTAVRTGPGWDAAFAGMARLAGLACDASITSLYLRDYGEFWCRGAADCAPLLAPNNCLYDVAAGESDVVEVIEPEYDPRCLDLGTNRGATNIRWYAGVALRASDGAILGILSLFDTRPRRLSTAHRSALTLAAAQIAERLSLLGRITELELLASAASPAPAHSLAQALVESASVVIYHSNVDGNLTYANPEYRRIFGLAPEQSTNDWVHGVHPDDRRRIEEAWEDFCRNPRAVRFDYRTKPINGTVRYFTEQVVPARGVAGYVGTISDFTDLINTRGALLRQQTLLEAVITDLPVALMACDVGGTITHYNRAAIELHCIDVEPHPKAAEMRLADGVTAVEPDHHPLARALRGETISNLELTILPQESAARSTLVSARRLVGPDGQTLGAVAVIQDTTEQKRAAVELERVNKELMSASRQAGMAEVATNVLHNVGNILNSVNISASLVAERVKQSKAPGVGLVADLLRDQGAAVGEFLANDPRGKRIPEYLATLGQQLVADQQMALRELASLRENMEHIKETVTMQQSYAKLCGVTETIDVADLVEDSLRLNAGAFARHGVTLSREFSSVPPITVDKHKVLQILVNLVRNAKYACDESGKTDKLITLCIGPTDDGVSISVRDNGIGIPADNMDRLFTHGFTTRRSGHGFGLHSGALAAQELGGKLRAESEGLGRGSAFILELPRIPKDLARG